MREKERFRFLEWNHEVVTRIQLELRLGRPVPTQGEAFRGEAG